MTMEDVTLIRDEKNSIYQKILFERPISRLQARKIGLLAGKHARLKKINDMHQIILAMKHDVAIVAESDLKSVGVPAQVYLENGKKISDPFNNSDEAISVLADCNYIVVGMDIEISSRLQIFLEKCIHSRQAPILFTSESIGQFKVSPHIVKDRMGDIYACSTKRLIELANYLDLPVVFSPNAGIYNKIDILKKLAKHLRAHIVCIEDYQILGCSYTNLNKATVTNIINTKQHSLDYLFIAILLSLFSDAVNPNIDITARMLTAGYLLRKSLNSKDSFISNLKATIQQ